MRNRVVCVLRHLQETFDFFHSLKTNWHQGRHWKGVGDCWASRVWPDDVRPPHERLQTRLISRASGVRAGLASRLWVKSTLYWLEIVVDVLSVCSWVRFCVAVHLRWLRPSLRILCEQPRVQTMKSSGPARKR